MVFEVEPLVELLLELVELLAGVPVLAAPVERFVVTAMTDPSPTNAATLDTTVIFRARRAGCRRRPRFDGVAGSPGMCASFATRRRESQGRGWDRAVSCLSRLVNVAVRRVIRGASASRDAVNGACIVPAASG